MKMFKVMHPVLVLLLAGVVGQAQSPQPQAQQDLQQAAQRLDLQRFYSSVIGAYQPGQRSGGRGPAVNAPVWISPADARSQGAWWMNTATIARLGLTDDQKTKLEKTFESHRQDLASRTETLNKEEAQLAKLLEADPLDRNAVFAQIDRVTQARGELERANSVMTMEMREVLTRAQWMQLQPSQRARLSAPLALVNLIMPVVPPVSPSGVQGSVTLETEISREGTVESVKALSGDAALVQAASDAVKQWHFRPILLNGQPSAIITNITVTFPFTGVFQPQLTGPGQRRGGGGRGPQ
jgi:TonB family protein